jgi:CheY-like chemotaxis protein
LGEKGGALEIYLQQVEVEDDFTHTQKNLKSGPHLKLTVSDTGCGMTPEVQERIFEPFFTTRPIGEGNGLGLAIVHGIVTGLGGAITVESTPGKGTTFYVYLPVSHDNAAPFLKGKRSAQVTLRILVIDDEEPVRTVLRQMLEKESYEVKEAANGAVGMSLLRNHPIDLVITDLFMPEKEGIETMIEMRKNFPQVKLIAMSGGGRMGKLDLLPMAESFGAQRTLAKPFERKELLEAVREVLGG